MEAETFTPTNPGEVEQHYVFLTGGTYKNSGKDSNPPARNRAISVSSLLISSCNDTTTIIAICVLTIIILAFIILILLLLLN
jgi:hypothetical protein